MCQGLDDAAEEPPVDGETVARALRRQIDAVKAQMQAHREIMQAAGIAPAPPEDEEGEDGPGRYP